MTDEQAYMELVLCNTQSELHPLEEGLHALDSDMTIREYAEKSGKGKSEIDRRKSSGEVFRACPHVGTITEKKEAWRQIGEIHAAPPWLWAGLVKVMIDEQAYMELVLCNTQSELHPLEEGKHAAESGMDLKAYAEQSGKNRGTLKDKVLAWRVFCSVGDVPHKLMRKAWSNLAEIHAALELLSDQGVNPKSP